MRPAGLLLLALLLGGCGTIGEVFTIEPVKPWERGVLAQQDMQLVSDKMEAYANDHMYFSKEAATGGKGVGGGGCGCN